MDLAFAPVHPEFVIDFCGDEPAVLHACDDSGTLVLKMRVLAIVSEGRTELGPVLQIVRAETFEEALSYPNLHYQGNAVTVFTRSGDWAQRFVAEVSVGMVGVNFPMPTPVGYYSHGGWKDSAFGDLNQYGEDSIRFFTCTKVVTQRWPHP